MANVTQDRLKELVHYDPASGIFTRIKDAGPNAKAGAVVGCKNSKGYLQVVIDGKHYKLHRLAFLYIAGSFPENEVDHINRDRCDNRWSNLRAATKSQNLRNVGPHKTNKSGYKGVCWRKDMSKWTAQIRADGKVRHLGFFDDPKEAHAAYARAAEQYSGAYAAAA